MIKCWIVYAFWLLTILLLDIFSASSGMFVLLCISVLLPAIIIIIHRFVRYNFDIFIDLPDSVEKDKPASGSINIINKTRMFCPLSKITLMGENILTGESQIFEQKCSLLPLKQISFDFKLKDSYCGKVSFKVNQIKTYDILGLTYKKSCTKVKGSVIILPEILSCDINISKLPAENIDSVDYSADKPGFDLSEPFEYREYTVSDSPKSIHWKLSQKLDKLIIRQGGMPSPTSALLILDTCLNKNASLPSFSRLSRTGEIFISLSKKLCDCQIAHTLCFYDHLTDEMFQCLISSEEDWFSIIPKILSVSFKQHSQTSLEHYCEINPQHFDNIFCITPCFNEQIQFENTNLTVLTVDDFHNDILTI